MKLDRLNQKRTEKRCIGDKIKWTVYTPSNPLHPHSQVCTLTSETAIGCILIKHSLQFWFKGFYQKHKGGCLNLRFKLSSIENSLKVKCNALSIIKTSSPIYVFFRSTHFQNILNSLKPYSINYNRVML